MAKRRLTKQQQRRIQQNQDRQHTLASDPSTEDLADSQSGTVITHYGSQADIEAENGNIYRCHLRANLGSIVTGDKVTWRAEQPKGVVVAIHPRHSELCRPDNQGKLRPVAANIDRIVLVIASKPEPHANLIDRYLVAAETQGIKTLLVLNKTDLLDETNKSSLIALLDSYRQLGYPALKVSSTTGAGIDALTEQLTSLTSVFVGQSGVGKSSLLNTLSPDINAAVGPLSQGAEKGTHTTTTSKLFHLPGGCDVIDSPGIREFGLWHLEPARVAEGFVDFHPFLGNCKFRDCQHKQEPDCAINAAVADRLITAKRMNSYRQIVQSLEEL